MITKKRITSMLVAFSMLAASVGMAVSGDKAVAAESYGLNNPVVEDISSEGYDRNNEKDVLVPDLKTTWDCVWFGNYRQYDTNGDGVTDDNDEKQPIKWRVLSVDGDDAFLLADECLDCKKYNEEHPSLTWETCTLRQWLNGTFMDEAFSDEEKNAIMQTTVVNEDNPRWDTEGGNDTVDKVYLLSLSEATNRAYGFPMSYPVNDYFVCSKTRRGKVTDYAYHNGAYKSDYGEYAGMGWWWLRSPGTNSDDAMLVDDNGDVYNYDIVGHGKYCVRPALHLNLSSSLWTYAGTVSSSDLPGEEYAPLTPGGENPAPAATSEVGDLDISGSGTAAPAATSEGENPVSPAGSHEPDRTPANPDGTQPLSVAQASVIPTAPSANQADSQTTPAPQTSVASASSASATNSAAIASQTPLASATPNPSSTTNISKPAAPSITSAKRKNKKTIVVKWEEVADADGYQLQYALDKKFKKSRKTKETSNVSLKLTKLKKKNYFIHVRAYKTNGSTKEYGNWSKTKKVSA
jgi:hypothetical protein